MLSLYLSLHVNSSLRMFSKFTKIGARSLLGTQSKLSSTNLLSRHAVNTFSNRSMSTLKIPSDGLEIFRCAYTPYYHRVMWVGVSCISAASVFLTYKAFIEKPEDRSPNQGSLATAAALAFLFVPATLMMHRGLRKIVHSVKLLPTNDLHITSMGWPNPGPPVVVPVNNVVPPLTDIRTTLFGRAFKVITDGDKFGKMKIETIFSIHPTGNLIKGKPKDAFDHICIDNTSFRLK